jgi:hypothetical protein
MHTASFFTTLIAARLHGIEGIDVYQKTTVTNQRGGLIIDGKGVEAFSNSTGCSHHGPMARPLDI